MLIDALAGFIFAIFTAYFFDVPLTVQWLFLGALFALLPDADFFVELLQRKTVGGKHLGAHRVLTHLPLLFIFLGFFFLWWQGTAVAFLFMLGSLWHFSHDAHAMGYGYRMLWPFSQKFFKFFSDKEGKYYYDRRHLLVSWTKEEVEELHQKYGNDDWITDHLRYHATNWQRPVITLLQTSLLLVLLCLLLLGLLS